MFHDNENYNRILEDSIATGNWVDFDYLKLVDDVLNNGEPKQTRAKIDGRNIWSYSVFGRQAKFSLTDGFPILTTKKINFNAIVHELLWFLSGSSNIKYLQDNNVHIWDAWSSKDGELGYGTYGTVWRKFPYYQYTDEQCDTGIFSSEFNHKHIKIGSIDQIKNLIDNINEVKKDPTASCGRRLIVTAWHPYYVDKVGLPPCHCFMQFNVTGDKLSCHLYQRSCDLFIGNPFNITSYSLLTYVIARITGLVAHEFIHTYGDLHIYENHISQLKEQLGRSPYKLPYLAITDRGQSIDDFVMDDFKLINYKSHEALKGCVAV